MRVRFGAVRGAAVRAPHVPNTHTGHIEPTSKHQAVGCEVFRLVSTKTGRVGGIWHRVRTHNKRK